MKTLRSRLIVLLVLALPSAAWAQRGDAVYVEDRLNQIQQSLTALTGQLEQMQYRNQQLQQQMEKMQADYEYRLDTLEKGGKAGPRPAAPAAGRTTPPAGGGNLAANAPPPAAAAAPGRGALSRRLQAPAGRRLRRRGAGFKAFVQRNPQHVLAGNAQYWLGETYYARRDYQNAMVAFAEGYKAYKTSPKGPDNLLKLGVTLAVLTRSRRPARCSRASTRTIRAPPTCRSGASTRSARRTAAGDACLPARPTRGRVGSSQSDFARALMAPFGPFDGAAACWRSRFRAGAIRWPLRCWRMTGRWRGRGGCWR